MHFDEKDEYLEARLAKFDQWIREGKIPTSSKVIPLTESLSGLQWVLPTQQAVEILRNMRTFALAKCQCRERYHRCDNPLEICILTNDTADQWVGRNQARYITLAEAKERLKLAHEYGLIHLTFYNPDQYIYALCSCCECCCHDLQFMKKYQRPDLVAHADYVATLDASVCRQCGACVKRCVFGAQEIQNDSVIFHPEQCYGCGVCVTTCPSGAISMKRREAKRKTP
ncbi:MAG TPA: 4Fe-4S dicluster domain-containing protein [Patescibacteria group bacterium]|nr:4Fe-4S dicluster domain-containing protein [Patescibacteria group bacterium]